MNPGFADAGICVQAEGPSTPSNWKGNPLPALITAIVLGAIMFGDIATATDALTLKQAYGKMFEVGAAIPASGLNDSELALLTANFTNVTPDNCLKPIHVQPEEGHFTFEEADAFVTQAQKLGLKINGHNLVWHESCPEWFFKDGDKPADRQMVLKRMRDHITAVVRRYRGRIASWDVVNEAVAKDGDSIIRSNAWMSALGPDYVAEAFLAAHQADPNAELYYNDYGIELPDKRERTLRLIRELKERGARIDGVGIEGHWQSGNPAAPVPWRDIEDAIIAFHNAGVKVMITELDLDVVKRDATGADPSQHDNGTDDPYVHGCPPEVLRRQAEDYAKLFALFRKHADMISRVTFWDLHDGRSWLNDWPRKRTNYPLLWGRNLQPKPAFFSVIQAANTPKPVTP